MSRHVKKRAPLITACPTAIRTVPDEKLLEKIPEDASVVVIGSNHIDPFHAVTELGILSYFAAKGYALGLEHTPEEQKQYNEMAQTIGFRPQHFGNKNIVVTDGVLCHVAAKNANAQANIFAHTYNSVANFKIIDYARALGMEILAADDPARMSYAADGYDPMTGEGVNRRNAYMADVYAAEVAKGKKILSLNASDHLYTLPESGALSLQHHLQNKGVVTYSASLLTDIDDAHVNNDSYFLFELAWEAANKVSKDVLSQWKFCKDNILDIDLRSYAANIVGKDIPDRWIVFNTNGSAWWQSHYEGNDAPVENALIEAVRRTRVLPAKRAKIT